MSLEDFTKMRLGKVIRRLRRKNPDGTETVVEDRVAKCPKCGRKGYKSTTEITNRRVTGRVLASYVHTAENAGFARLVREHCEVVEVEGEWTPAEEGAVKP